MMTRPRSPGVISLPISSSSPPLSSWVRERYPEKRAGQEHPVIHPHLEAVGGEVHHLRRYESYPDISFLLEKEPFTDDEDIAIITDIFKRESINVRASLRFVRFIDSDPGEVLNAIDIH
jgi:hypothetical protein